MSINRNLSIDYNEISNSVKFRKMVFTGLLITGIGFTLTPFLFKTVFDRESKTLMLTTGLIASLTASFMPKNSLLDKLKNVYEKTKLDQLKQQLTHEIAQQDTLIEIENKQALAQYVETNIPDFQLPFWAKRLEISELISKFYVDADTEESFEKLETSQPVVTTSNTIFENVIEKIEKDDSISLTWLKKAITESCFVAGKKGSGKSHLLRWLLAGFIAQSSDKDLFYVIDKHYDSDSPWVFGNIDESELVKRGRIVDGKKAIAAISELHQSLLNRIENGLTYKKTGSHVRVIIDEIDSYPEEEMEIISAFAKDVEYQGRKFGFSIHLGAHSIKKGEMGIDSSILGSMLNILYPSVVLDRNSVLSGAYPTVQVMKRMIERYKSQAPKDSRVVVIGDDFEVFVSHVPKLELVQINVENSQNNQSNEPQDTPKNVVEPQQQVNASNPIEKLKSWLADCYEQNSEYPTHSEISEAYTIISGQKLTDNGLKLLIAKLGL